MLSRDVAIVLIGVGVFVFVIGWAMILSNYGVDIETCTTYVSVPNKFEGALSLLGNYTRYNVLVFAKIANVSIDAGKSYVYSFHLDKIAVAPFLMQFNIVSSSGGVDGSVLLRDSKNNSLAYVPLQYSANVVSDQRFIATLSSLPPGNYTVEINAKNSFKIVSFNITSLTYETSPSIKIDLTPSSWSQQELKYVCKIDARGLFGAAALMGFGLAIIAFVSVDAYRSLETSKAVLPVTKPKAKAKRK